MYALGLKRLLGPWSGVAKVGLKGLFGGQIFRAACELTEPDPCVDVEIDVEIPTSYGKLLANVFKPNTSAGPFPVVMCAHPYNNHNIPYLPKSRHGGGVLGGVPVQYRIIPQAERPSFSTFTSWESPDPNFWCKNGYVVVNLNLPGFGGSDGPATVIDEVQGDAYCQAIEWVAEQSWCTGKIGCNGVSFLAISQYVLCCNNGRGKVPKALKCISPWEGMSDLRRDVAFYGGVADAGFLTFWYNMEVKPSFSVQGAKGEEAFIQRYGAIPPEWPTKISMDSDFFTVDHFIDLEKIETPMLVCASWSDHNLHSTGSLRAFRKARGPKWLYTHRWGKWDCYYSKQVQELTLKFFDHYVKGISNGWEETPQCRIEVRSARDTIHRVYHCPSWPVPGTREEKLFLTAQGKLSSSDQGATAKTVSYSGYGGSVSFLHCFEQDTELVGHMAVHVNMHVQGADDMAVFVVVKKRDKNGRFVPFYGTVGCNTDGVTRGQLLASYRQLDPEESSHIHPVIAYKKSSPLQEAEVVPLDIPLEPSGTFFAAGEYLELVFSSDEIIPTPPYVKSTMGNKGTHHIHTNGSYLLVPKTPMK